jgi:hypothetical protein
VTNSQHNQPDTINRNSALKQNASIEKIKHDDNNNHLNAKGEEQDKEQQLQHH